MRVRKNKKKLHMTARLALEIMVQANSSYVINIFEEKLKPKTHTRINSSRPPEPATPSMQLPPGAVVSKFDTRFFSDGRYHSF